MRHRPSRSRAGRDGAGAERALQVQFLKGADAAGAALPGGGAAAATGEAGAGCSAGGEPPALDGFREAAGTCMQSLTPLSSTRATPISFFCFLLIDAHRCPCRAFATGSTECVFPRT